MTIQRMDNVGVVVDDLAAVTAFFVALGLELEGEATVGGPEVDSLVALEGVRCDLTVVRTPDGHGRLELMKFHAPAAPAPVATDAPVNALGIRRIMFAVEDIEAVLARVGAHAVPIGELVQHGDSHRLCYVRGPEGLIVALAEKLR